MAEQVNQRIEDMINELEQMKRINLFNDDEIRDISRKRREFEYRIQRRVKAKDDFVHYVAYELALLEDISIRRKLAKMGDKKKDIEYAITKRLNKIFKQFIYRFQNDIEVYFQYIKFCKGVGFDHSISGIIGQMLQIHGEKPKMWQMAALFESEEQNNLIGARDFLLKGIHRHPNVDYLYLDIFKIELILASKAGTDEEKEKQLKRADIIWRSGLKNIKHATSLFKFCDLALKFDNTEIISNEIKKEIWLKRDNKEIWPYIASKELEGQHWTEIEEFVNEEYNFNKNLNNYMVVYEEALQQFPDPKLCVQYIHGLLGVSNSLCNDLQKISAVKHAWMFGHDSGLLTNDMYGFGFELLKSEGISNDELREILEAACKKNPQAVKVWEEMLLLNQTNEKKILEILQEANKTLKPDDALQLWNLALEYIVSTETLNTLFKKIQNCENIILLTMKPKLLKKMYKQNGLKAARTMYEEFIKIPPTQLETHLTMIEIERSQEKINMKNIRKCFECAVQHHGMDSVFLWMEYMKFEIESGNSQDAPLVYRRAVSMLQKELVDDFIKAQTINKLK